MNATPNLAAFPTLLTVPEVAKALRVGKAAIYRAIERGELRSLRLDPHGRLRISVSALEEYVGAAVDVGEPPELGAA